MLKIIGTLLLAVGLTSGVQAGTSTCTEQAQVIDHCSLVLQNGSITPSKVTTILRHCTKIYFLSLSDLEAAYNRNMLTITELNKAGVTYYDVWYVAAPGVICLNDSDL